MHQSDAEFHSEFSRVLKATHGEVRAYLASVGVPLDCVDDLAQEVFLAWHRAPQQRPVEVEAVRWLKGIARRMAMNFFRSSKRMENRRLSVVAELLATESLDLAMPTDETAELALEQCLGELAEKNRAVLKLRYEEDLPSNVIGARLDMTAEAVRILLMRLRSALRECISKRMKEDLA